MSQESSSQVLNRQRPEIDERKNSMCDEGVNRFCLCLILGLTYGWAFLGASLQAAEKPNVVFILADDLAWSDLGCYGHRYHQTPNLDKLAAEGLRFTQAYAPAPICSASRAALLTGRTPARLNFEFVTKDKPGEQKLGQPLQSPPFTLNLPLEEETIGEVLTKTGYHTAFFGKWHLNQHHGGYLGWSPTHGPLQQGFAEGNADFGSHPYAYFKKSGNEELTLPDGTYAPDSLTEKVIDFLQRPHEKPFFLYWSHYFVHDPIHSRCRWLLDKYRRVLPAGTSEERVAYAAMVETLDHQVGRFLEALKSQDLADQTLVVFMSDNGGHPNYTANSPLRGSKWNLYEGGIRVPLIVRWPGSVPQGAICEQAVHGCDLFPTFADAAGASVDTTTPRDGISLASLFRNPTQTLPERPLIWHFPYYHPEKGFKKAPSEIGMDDFETSQTRPHSALRLGRYKLLHFDEDHRNELYDLEADLSETRDLSRKEPDLTQRLSSQLDALLKEAHARQAVPAH